MKQFFPDVEFNKQKRKNYLFLLILATVLIGGLSATFFIMNQPLLAIIVLFILVVVFSSIPSALANYPVKNDAIIEINNGKVKLYGKEEIKTSDIIGVTVCIDVPKVGQTKAEQEAFFHEQTLQKPTEPVLGTCDILVKDEKGKEVTKYHVISDCIGALEAFLAVGVKKYRILYCMKKLTDTAKYQLYASKAGDASDKKFENLTEDDRLKQLL